MSAILAILRSCGIRMCHVIAFSCFYALLWHENCGNSVVSEYVPCHATAKTVNVHDCAHIWTAAYMHVGADNKRVLIKAKTLMAEDIVSRSPESVRYATSRAEDVLETMRKLNLGSSEKLKELYRETQSEEEFDETLTFVPEAIAEQISLWMQILPRISKDEKFVRSSSLYNAVEYLRDCSMLVLTTSPGHPFIGINKPVRTVLTGNLATLYYPLSSQVAVILTDDGQHIFEKRSVSYRQLKDFNEVAFNDGNWNLVFCERSDYLNAYLRTEGTSNEQD